MEDKFLSIIIPVYNAEKFLKECLDSCINQDVDHSEYEIICVNDGSPDNSLQILKEYEEKYENVKVFSQENSGVSTARNLGIANANGKYIWFVDSDDFIAPNCLKELKTLGELDYDLINFSAYSFVETLSDKENELLAQGKLKCNEDYWGYACFHLYRNSVIKDSNLSINEKIKYGEDEMFYAIFYEHARFVVNLNKVFYLYRGHSNSAMNSLNLYENKLRRMQDVIYSMTILKKGIEGGEYKKSISNKLLKERYDLSQCGMSQLKKEDCKTLLREMQQENLFESTVINTPKLKDYKKTIRKNRPSFINKLMWYIKHNVFKAKKQ